MTVELDYAFIADFAVVQDGKLNVIGASFTRAGVPSFPGGLTVAIAGRLRTTEDHLTVPIGVTITAPDDGYTLNIGGEITATDPHVYRGKVGILFAFNLAIPIVSGGLYVVNVSVEGEQVRRLAFDAVGV